MTLASRGWRVTALEPSPEACAEAQRARRGVRAGDADDGLRPDCPAASAPRLPALARARQRPVDDLRAARALLAPGGLALISLPNFGSWQRRRFGSDWFHLDLPRHRSHFTRDGLAALLGRAGLSGVETSTSTSADGLPMSLQYRRSESAPLRSGPALYAATAATLAAAPLTALADRAARDGDLLHAVARA